MFNQIIPSFEKEGEEKWDDNFNCFLNKICICGMCGIYDTKQQYFKCHHWQCSSHNTEYPDWCFVCGSKNKQHCSVQKITYF